ARPDVPADALGRVVVRRLRLGMEDEGSHRELSGAAAHGGEAEPQLLACVDLDLGQIADATGDGEGEAPRRLELQVEGDRLQAIDVDDTRRKREVPGDVGQRRGEVDAHVVRGTFRTDVDGRGVDAQLEAGVGNGIQREAGADRAAALAVQHEAALLVEADVGDAGDADHGRPRIVGERLFVEGERLAGVRGQLDGGGGRGRGDAGDDD